MTITPVFDEAFAREQFNDEVNDLPFFIDTSRRNAANLGTLIGRTHVILGAGCLVEPQSPHIPIALHLMADTHVAMFKTLLSDGSPTVAKRGPGEPVRYVSRADESVANVGRWLTGFYVNLLR